MREKAGKWFRKKAIVEISRITMAVAVYMAITMDSFSSIAFLINLAKAKPTREVIAMIITYLMK